MTPPALAPNLDPVKFEIFSHRLWAIGEEGRIALQHVTASPIVAQGGECMCSFYDADGTMVLACSGHLRFAAATSDAIRKIVEWYEDSPGIHDGDEFVLNDPYVAGSHTYDIIQVAPVFYDGKRMGWVASSSHTADTGGVLRGAATEIYHEGIRILGVKLFDRGEFRDDVFKTLVEQCRDPSYVALDMKSRTAANRVCAQGYLSLIERFGADFVKAAGAKLIEDAERMARDKLASLPDGTWRSRIYGVAGRDARGNASPYQVLLTLAKEGARLSLDFTGSSPQVVGDQNSTLPSTLAHVAVALTGQLFWDVPWSDGKMRPVEIRVEEGSILHCRFPSACGRSTRVGQWVAAATAECVAKMLYAGGHSSDVNASWMSLWYAGGPGHFYGGHNHRGLTNPQGLYDSHGGGLGAATTRDGIHCGGHMNIPAGGISDVELIEMQYPFLYLSRKHNPDGGGGGRFNGGAGSARFLQVRGSTDVTVDVAPYGGIPQGAFGLFGGYPVGAGGLRAVLEPAPDVGDRMAQGDYPVSPDVASAEGWADVTTTEAGRIGTPEGHFLSDFVQGGGGYGDPLDRTPETVAHDIQTGLVTVRTAQLLYGVVVDDALVVDQEATRSRREAIRRRRLAGRRRESFEPPASKPGWQTARRIHEYLEQGTHGTASYVRCQRCETLICEAGKNYKHYVPCQDLALDELAGRPMPDGSPYLGVLREYSCPGCGTLLQVDVFCEALGGEQDLWDIDVTV